MLLIHVGGLPVLPCREKFTTIAGFLSSSEQISRPQKKAASLLPARRPFNLMRLSEDAAAPTDHAQANQPEAENPERSGFGNIVAGIAPAGNTGSAGWHACVEEGHVRISAGLSEIKVHVHGTTQNRIGVIKQCEIVALFGHKIMDGRVASAWCVCERQHVRCAIEADHEF